MYTTRKLNKYIQRIIKDRQKIKDVMENKYIFKNGKYRIISDKKIIAYIRNPQTISFINRNKTHLSRERDKLIWKLKNCIKDLIGVIASFDFTTKTGQVDFGADLLMITRNGDVKAFDFDKGLVFNYVNCKEEYNNRKKTYIYFREYFKTPIIEYEDKSNMFLEQFINFKPYMQWDEKEKQKAVQAVFDNYYVYFSKISNQKNEIIYISEIIDKFSEITEDNQMVNNFITFISAKEKNEAYPVVINHGDLNFNNILLKDNEYFFIDWDLSGKQIFFCDLMNIFFSEAYWHDNYFYLDKYLNGEYDMLFNKIFKIFNLQFECDSRKHYLVIYAMDRITNLECRIGYDLEETISKYSEILYRLNCNYSVADLSKLSPSPLLGILLRKIR